MADILDARALAAYLQGRLREAADLADHVARLFLDAGELLRVGMVRGVAGWPLPLTESPRGMLPFIGGPMVVAFVVELVFDDAGYPVQAGQFL